MKRMKTENEMQMHGMFYNDQVKRAFLSDTRTFFLLFLYNTIMHNSVYPAHVLYNIVLKHVTNFLFFLLFVCTRKSEE